MQTRIRITDKTNNGCEVPKATIRADSSRLYIDIEQIATTIEVPIEIVLAAIETEEHG